MKTNCLWQGWFEGQCVKWSIHSTRYEDGKISLVLEANITKDYKPDDEESRLKILINGAVHISNASPETIESIGRLLIRCAEETRMKTNGDL